MKRMITYTLLSALMAGASLTACSDDDALTAPKDWAGTTEYFAPTDEAGFATYYKPAVGYVGDPMPFYDPVAKDFKVMYLQDFRPNPAGTYHPIWAVSTKDAATYTSMGELIGCGAIDEQDAAIGTGSTVYDEKQQLYYTFYTGNKYMPSSTDYPQVVMLATSADFKTWTKDRTFYLKPTDYGYERNDFRDPFVFAGDDGLYHMLVSTKKNGKGVLAEFTSHDLRNWNHAGVFMTMMWDRFYECPDVFRMGNYWYLVYSEIHDAIRKVQYFKGSTLDELKAATANDAGIWPDDHEGFLDSRGLYAGKTASDGQNRYIWGWCATRSGNDNANGYEWAGSLMAHRVMQNADGTLYLAAVPGIDAKYTGAVAPKVMEGSDKAAAAEHTIASGNHLLLERLGHHNKISFTAIAEDANTRFGFSFARGTDSEQYISLVVNPEDGGNKKKVNMEEEGEAGAGFLSGMDSYLFPTPADNTYNVTIYTDNSVAVVYINNVLAHTVRIYGLQQNCWSINAYSGSVDIRNLSVAQ